MHGRPFIMPRHHRKFGSPDMVSKVILSLNLPRHQPFVVNNGKLSKTHFWNVSGEINLLTSRGAITARQSGSGHFTSASWPLLIAASRIFVRSVVHNFGSWLHLVALRTGASESGLTSPQKLHSNVFLESRKLIYLLTQLVKSRERYSLFGQKNSTHPRSSTFGPSRLRTISSSTTRSLLQPCITQG